MKKMKLIDNYHVYVYIYNYITYNYCGYTIYKYETTQNHGEQSDTVNKYKQTIPPFFVV